MSHDSDKEQTEKEVFHEFLARSCCDIVEDSIVSGDHVKDEPDILCMTHSGETLGFELSGITDENLMKVQMRWEPKNGEYTRTSDPSRKIVSEKLKKVYGVFCPVHLLIYRNYVGTPDSMVVEQIRQTCKQTQHRFASIWYMGQELHRIE